MAELEPFPAARIPGWIKRVVPVVVSALILYYYFRDQDWAGLWASVKGAHLVLGVLSLAAPQLLFWFFDVLIVERHLTWFHGPFSWRDYLWARGAIYILQLANTAVGGIGGVLLYIKRKSCITWKKLMGILLFRFGLTLWGIGIFMIPATLAIHHYGLADKVRLNLWAWWALLIFGVVYLVQSWVTWHHDKHFGLSKLVVRDKDSEFWTAFRTASRRQWFLTWAMALPPFFLMLAGFYFTALAFGIEIPLVEFMVLSPLFLLIMDLPIAFAGFGTATMAWMVFFGDYGSEEAIAAVTLFIPFVRGASRSMIGLVSLSPAIKELDKLLSPEPVQAPTVGIEAEHVVPEE